MQRNKAVRRPGQPYTRVHWRQDDPGTMDAGDVYGGGSPTGITFYENGALGEKWEGLLLSCEAALNTIFGYKPVPKEGTFELERFVFLTSNPGKEYDGADFSGRKEITKNENGKHLLESYLSILRSPYHCPCFLGGVGRRRKEFR